jgi:phosphopantetheinyl transferase (holo-ACP synthase)
MDEKKILEIINRITGKNFEASASIKLSSAQQYAFITLCRKAGKIVNKNIINNNFTIKDVLKENTILSSATNKIAKSKIKMEKMNMPNLSVGIDIQNIEEFTKLIDNKKDLTKSDFVNDYFTKKEIDYSLGRPNSIETICGIFSVKECIKKSGYSNDLKSIEILYNKEGRPFFKDYSISISHSAGTCVAICIK